LPAEVARRIPVIATARHVRAIPQWNPISEFVYGLRLADPVDYRAAFEATAEAQLLAR
jgi:hypothetical protein